MFLLMLLAMFIFAWGICLTWKETNRKERRDNRKNDNNWESVEHGCNIRLTDANRDLLTLHNVQFEAVPTLQLADGSIVSTCNRDNMRNYFVEEFGAKETQRIMKAFMRTSTLSRIPLSLVWFPLLRLLEIFTRCSRLTNKTKETFLNNVGIKDERLRAILLQSFDNDFSTGYGLAEHWRHYLIEGKSLTRNPETGKVRIVFRTYNTYVNYEL